MSFNISPVIWDELRPAFSPAEPPPEISYNFTTDPLLVSCTLYRMIQEAKAEEKFTYHNWSLVEHLDKIVVKITDQDRIFAEALRSYYKSKLIMAKLRGDHFTKFKTDLLQYLNDSPMTILHSYVGMIYKLPYFYQYDMELVEIFGGERIDLEKAPAKLDRHDINLSFIQKADNGQKRARHYEYWFKDENNLRILVEVEKHNPIRNLWEQRIQNGDLNINAIFDKKRRDNLEFYVAKAWTINV
jgi:hypothetical protein